MKTKRIGIFSGLLVLVFILVASARASAQEDLPWSNETDVIIFPSPSLPPFFSDFNITPTEIQIGDDLIIRFVITNTNNHSYTWMSTTRIGDFFTQIIEIELDAYESKLIWYRIIPHLIGAQYDVWIDGQTGTFMVIPPDPLPITNETDPVIIVTDPLEELTSKIDYLNTNLQDLTGEVINLRTAYDELQDADAHLKSDQIHEYEWIVALGERVDEQDVQIEELYQTLEYLEDKTSRNQNNILYSYIAIATIVIVSIIYFIRKRS